jgi:DNA-binding NarL/FixJ family response regulator
MTKNEGAPIRILLVDDHPSVRAGMRMLLESHPRMSVVGEASNREEAMERLKARPEARANLILLDLDLGGHSALDFLPELIKAADGAPVLVFTGILDTVQHEAAAKLGAMGVMLKSKNEQELFKAIEKVHAGEPWLDRAMIGKLLSERSGGADKKKLSQEQERIASLTPRELEIIAAICAGATKNKQIADELCIAEVTVRHHLTSIFDKLGLTDRLELIIYAYRHNLAELPGA